MVKFIVLASPRSGSTLFRLWLNSHKFIRCHDEVLLKRLDAQDSIHHFVTQNRTDGTPYSSYIRESLGYPDDAPTSRLLQEFLDDLFYNRAHCAPWNTPGDINNFHPATRFDQETAVGFKLMYYTLGNHFLNNWITDNSIHIIHLVRENILKQYLSSLVAKKRKVWFSDQAQGTTRIQVDLIKLKAFLPQMMEMQTNIRDCFAYNPGIGVSYETFCSTPRLVAADICKFLGTENSGMTMPSLKKLNPAHISDIVENYDELYKALKDTRYSAFLD